MKKGRIDPAFFIFGDRHGNPPTSTPAITNPCSDQITPLQRSCLMPPLFRSTSLGMKDETPRQRREWLWGLPASVILHALVFSFLVYGLTKSPDQPKNDQAVDVSLVPAPEPPKPKPAPEPDKKEPEKPQKTAEKPPAPEKAPENPPEQQKQQPNPPPAAEARPVFQYGDKDAGPRKSPDGSSAQDSAKSPEKADDSTPPAPDKDTDEKAVAAKEAEQPKDSAKQPDGAEVPLAATGGDNDVALPATADAPEPKPANAAREADTSAAKSGPQGDSKLPGARRLSSQEATKDELATAAIAGLPRDKRVGLLCSSRLEAQLQGASYNPGSVPKFWLKAGNVIDCPNSAFGTQMGRWYKLSFRCEVDSDATKVVSFNYRVGAKISPEEQDRYRKPRCQ